MAAVRFDDSDLAANREGKLSPAQLADLEHERNVWRVTSTITLIAIPVVIFGIIARGIETHDTVNSIIGLVLAFGVILSVFYFRWRRRAMQFERDRTGGTVSSASGKVILRGMFFPERSAKRFCRVTVANIWLTMPRRAYLTLKKGEVYKLYFAPSSKWFLSAEPAHQSEQ
jgi:hypothetical protein